MELRHAHNEIQVRDEQEERKKALEEQRKLVEEESRNMSETEVT